jgi:hypothetical protein
MSIQTPGLQIPYGIQPTNPLPVETWSGPFYGTTVTNACAVALSSIPQAVRLINGGKINSRWVSLQVLV